MDSQSKSKQSDFNLLGKMRRAENSKGKKSNVVVPDSMKLEKPAAAVPSNGLMKLLTQNSALIMQTVGVIIVVILASTMYNSSSNAIKNLVNANPDTLKEAFMGDLPYLFYCHRGGKDETVPQIFSELNKVKGPKMEIGRASCRERV